MKTTATAVVWRRVLSVCLLCALWGEGTVRAEETGDADVIILPPKAEEAIDAGGRAADVQFLFSGNILTLSIEAKELLEAAKGAGDDENAKKITAAVENVTVMAESLHTSEPGVRTAVGDAGGKTVGVVEEALKLTGDVPGATVTQKKIDEWKKKADEADKLWEEAAKKTELQFLTTERMFEEVESAIAAAVNANNDGGFAFGGGQKVKNQPLEDGLRDLYESMQNAKDNAKNVKDLVQTAKEKTEEAVNEALTKATAKINNLVNPAKQETGEESEGVKTTQLQDVSERNKNPTRNDASGKTPTKDTETPSHDLLGGAGNKTTNDVSSNTTTEVATPDGSNKDTSFDGSPLTVSCFAATLVLFLLARVAAVMITA